MRAVKLESRVVYACSVTSVMLFTPKTQWWARHRRAVIDIPIQKGEKDGRKRS